LGSSDFELLAAKETKNL